MTFEGAFFHGSLNSKMHARLNYAGYVTIGKCLLFLILC